jgi:hypothetical protein
MAPVYVYVYLEHPTAGPDAYSIAGVPGLTYAEAHELADAANAILARRTGTPDPHRIAFTMPEEG